MNTHISYETAKRLKEFLGDKAPEPMVRGWYLPKSHDITELRAPCFNQPPAYQLHDLLSKPFCEAVVKAGKEKQGIDTELVETTLSDWPEVIARIYFDGGLPAVEKALIEMMEGK